MSAKHVAAVWSWAKMRIGTSSVFIWSEERIGDVQTMAVERSETSMNPRMGIVLT
jgi:hypothetical protein